MLVSLFYVATNLLTIIALAVTLLGIDTTFENITRVTLCVAGGDQPEGDKYRDRLNQHLLPVLVFDFYQPFSSFWLILLICYLCCSTLKT